MEETRVEKIRARLLDALDPEMLEIEDESHLHAGHAGARDGRGHFRVTIISEAFKGAPPLRRHRMIYDALGSMMQTDIHALTIQAVSSEEV